MKKVLGYYFYRQSYSNRVSMSQGKREWKENAEYFRIYNLKNRLVAEGPVNATLFLSKTYGNGQGIEATDRQIIDAVTHDESIF